MSRSVSFPKFLSLPTALLLVIGLLQPHSVAGMIDRDRTITCQTDDTFFDAWSFDFAAGGFYSLNISLVDAPTDPRSVNATVQVMLATDDQLAPVRSATMDDVCAQQPFSYVPTLWQVSLGLGAVGQPAASITFDESMPSGFTHLLVLNCDRRAFTLGFSSIAMNPGGEYLSMADVPQKALHSAFSIIWTIILVAWGIHLFIFFWWNIRLQAWMALMPLTRAAYAFATYAYWIYASHEGVYSTLRERLVLFVSSVDYGAWICVVYLIACGYKYLKARLTLQERQMLALMAMLLAPTYAVYLEYGGFLVFITALVALLALRIIFAAIVANGNRLVGQAQILRRHDIDANLTPLGVKVRAYRYLQGTVISYVSLALICQLWSSIFLKSRPWIAALIEHLLGVGLFACLALAFGMRAGFNPYFAQILAAILDNPDLQQPAPLAPDAGEDPDFAAHGGDSASTFASSSFSAAADEVEVGSDGRHHSSTRMRAIGGSGEGYHSLSADPVRGQTHGAGARTSQLVTDRVWRPFQDVPPLPPAGSLHWRAPQANLVGVVEEPLLIVDTPLVSAESDHPLQLGRAIRIASEIELGAAADSSAANALGIPEAALPYLPRTMRAALDRQQHQQPLLQHAGPARRAHSVPPSL